MKCEKCGADLNKNANFCRVCGAQVLSNSLNSHSKTKDLSNSLNEENIVVEEVNKNSVDVSKSSDEIKKILDEMTSSEKKNEEPTMSIPTDLIDKYCKNKKINKDIEKNDDSTLKNESVESVINESKKDVELSTNSIETEEIEVNTTENIEKKELTDEKNLINEKVNVETLNELKILDDDRNLEEKIDTVKFDSKVIESDKEHSKIKEEKNSIEDKKIEKVHYGRKFLIFFIIMVCLCFIAYLVYVLYGSRTELEKVDKEKTILQEEISNLKNNSFSNDNSTDGVIFNGYKFSSVSGNYSVMNDSLILDFNNVTYSIKINNKINFESLKNSKEQYIKQLVHDGYKILSYGNKHVNENDYYVFAVADTKSNKMLVAYSQLDESSVIAFVIKNKENSIDYNLLNQANSIISSVSKNISSNSNDLNVFIEKN